MKSLCPLWPSQRDNLDLVRLCSWLTFPFFVLYNLVYPTAMTLKSPELGALFSSLLLLEGEPGFCEREIRTGRDSGPFSVRREVADGELLCLIKKSPDKATGMPERTGFPWITEPWNFCCEMVFLACSCGSEGTAPAVWLPAPPSLWNSILRVLSKAWVWRSFRNIYLHFFTLASANSGRWALSQKGLHCFFLLAVCSTAPSCSSREFGVAKTNPPLREHFIVPEHSDEGTTLYLKISLWASLQRWELDLEFDSRFCGRLVQWQKASWDVFAGACAVEDPQSRFLCLFLCVQGSSLPKPEHWVLSVLLLLCPGSSLQSTYGRAEHIHHTDTAAHTSAGSCRVSQTCLGLDLLFSPNKQQPLRRKALSPPPACCLVTSKL